MGRVIFTAIVAVAAMTGMASWYWPFGDNGEEPDQPRLSELMEPATTNIDAAADFAAEGKVQEAVERYRAALAALQKVEDENVERAATPEFASLRNKKAYVTAAIHSMLLEQARENAKAVAVTDTTELEMKMKKRNADLKAQENAAKAKAAKAKVAKDGESKSADDAEENAVKSVKRDSQGRPKMESQIDKYMAKERKHDAKLRKKAAKSRQEKAVKKEIQRLLKQDPESRKARMMQSGEDLRNGELGEAKKRLAKLLAEKPGDSAALNLLAACQAAEGDLKAAEATLDSAITSNPRDYHGYYNMANIYLLKGNKSAAKRYYESGRMFNGPKDKELEAAVEE